ncbi:MAG: sulfatase-like hydrolase/transferase [Actinobacteria bacterium]|nr:sulfatase-like hydrolase/transferase [Actinomycetota bacterium]
MPKSFPSRRSFLKSLGYSSAAFALSSSLLSACATGKKRPNILFIFSDDHGYQAISAYGGRLKDIAPTPNIDKIAEKGMLFKKCYVTNSICAPSRATILTGKHSHLNGVIDNRVKFDGSQQTFPKLLRKVGYQTAIVGKWHLKTEPTGFEFWQVLPGQGQYYNPDFLTPEGKKRETGYVTDIIADKTIDWLENKRDKEKPFYDLGEWELYDLENDPHEMHSEYDNPQYAPVVADLKKELARLRKFYKLPPLKPDPKRI